MAISRGKRRVGHVCEGPGAGRVLFSQTVPPGACVVSLFVVCGIGFSDFALLLIARRAGASTGALCAVPCVASQYDPKPKGDTTNARPLGTPLTTPPPSAYPPTSHSFLKYARLFFSFSMPHVLLLCFCAKIGAHCFQPNITRFFPLITATAIEVGSESAQKR